MSSMLHDLQQIVWAGTYKASYRKAKASRSCIRCGGAAAMFRNASARMEYQISALCQKCQDECFGCTGPEKK